MGEPVTGNKDLPASTSTADATTTGPSETKPAVTGDGAEGVTPTPAASKTPVAGTTSKASKRNSVFGGLFGKKDSPKSTTAESGPAVPAKDVPAKDESSTVAATAPQLDNPVKSPTTDATTSATADAVTKPTEPVKEKAAESTAASSPSPAAATATTPTDKRRTSFFSGLGTKKEKRAGATSGDELTDGEGKKSGGVGGLFRKASRVASKPATSSATGAPTTKTAAPDAAAAETDETAKAAEPAKTAETTETKAAEPTEVPLPKAEPTAEDVTKGPEATTSGEKSDLAAGKVGSNAIASQETSTPVEATA